MDRSWVTGFTVDAEYVAEYETALKWSIYACFTGYPFNFGVVHVKRVERSVGGNGQGGTGEGEYHRSLLCAELLKRIVISR